MLETKKGGWNKTDPFKMNINEISLKSTDWPDFCTVIKGMVLTLSNE